MIAIGLLYTQSNVIDNKQWTADCAENHILCFLLADEITDGVSFFDRWNMKTW